MRLLLNIILVLSFCQQLLSNGIFIHKKDAEVWSVNQTINGTVSSNFATVGVLYLNEDSIDFAVSNSEFSVPLILDEGENIIFVEIDSAGTPVRSDTLFLTLAYELLPELRLIPEVSGNQVTLRASVIENPKELPLTFFWYADESNPDELAVTGSDSIASVTIPPGSIAGEYYFRLIVTTSENDSAYFGTFVTVDSTDIVPFDIKKDYAGWIDSAVLYEITPYIFTRFEHFAQITNKLPEIHEMGINTIWIQPVMSTAYGGQGYDITDYFKLRTDLGTEEELIQLIQTAKELGMRVLFDLVLNHSSIHHRYVIDAVNNGEDSHYYDFYQRSNDGSPYSQHYNTLPNGLMYYFWTDLVMYNYQNPEVRRWMIEAAKYWIRKYDIDGYRFDAIWGVNARAPQFAKEMRLALKSMKPEILLLAEDKATWPETFDERFDVAFDWYPEEGWVSHWVYQTFYSSTSNPTIFNNSNQNNRAFLLRNALTNFGNGFYPKSKILRFIGNNDIYHFMTHHGEARTKMAATLIFALDGIPLVYNGQEIGLQGHPYGTEFIFLPGPTIKSQDGYGLYPLYKRLSEIRRSLPAMYNRNFEEITIVPNNYTFAFRRWEKAQNVICLINMGDTNVETQLNLPIQQMQIDSSKTYYLTDLISGDYFPSNYFELENINIPVDKFTTRILSLADTIAVVVSVKEEPDTNIPTEFKVSQNYPNPFNPTTTISYSLPEPGKIKIKVFDSIGKEIKLLVDKYEERGNHWVEFDGRKLSSGVYYYQIGYHGQTVTKKMVLIK